jgi:methionyl-tRNA synthetase
MNKKIFIGVAWPYVNGDLHIGHLAGYLLPADITARFHRYLGDNVLMVSGSDCFGTPITVEAEKKNLTPEELINQYYPKHLEVFEKSGISFDIFTKTITKEHIKITQDFFLNFYKKGYIYKEKVEQYFDPKSERFLPDRYVEGECPYCGFKRSRSDQCDECGRVLEQKEIKNPRNKITGESVILKESEHYFFDLKKVEPFIKEYVKKIGKNWKDWVKKETEGWLSRGLKNRAFTRDLSWGVPLPISKIPEDDRIENIENKRIYVWWEAVIGYLSASVEWAKENNRDWKEFWYNKDSYHYYFMGKDNLPFHTMFWPAELHIYDEKIHLPDRPVINQYLNFGSEQFSKSRGIIVDSGYIIEEYGLDAVRFYLTLIMPEYADTSFSWTDFVERHNSLTIANLGNFINRTINMTEGLNLDSSYIEDKILDEVNNYLNKAKKDLLESRFKDYAETILSLSRFGNGYLSEKTPWKIDDEIEKAKILSNAVFITLTIQAIIKPLLINSYLKLQENLNTSFNLWPESIDVIKEKFNEVKIKKTEPLFKKIDKDIIKNETNK